MAQVETLPIKHLSLLSLLLWNFN